MYNHIQFTEQVSAFTAKTVTAFVLADTFRGLEMTSISDSSHHCATCVKKKKIKKKIVCAAACAARNSALRNYVDTEKHNVLAGWGWRCGVGLGGTSLKNQLKTKKQKRDFLIKGELHLLRCFPTRGAQNVGQ